MEVAILSFFTRHDPFFHHAKFQLPLRPPSTFLGVFWNCWQILSSKIFLIFFLCKIWVIAAPNKHFLGVWYQKWMRNKLLLLHFFSTFLNPQRTTLTYSAVMCLYLYVSSLIWLWLYISPVLCSCSHGGKVALPPLWWHTLRPARSYSNKVEIFNFFIILNRLL